MRIVLRTRVSERLKDGSSSLCASGPFLVNWHLIASFLIQMETYMISEESLICCSYKSRDINRSKILLACLTYLNLNDVAKGQILTITIRIQLSTKNILIIHDKIRGQHMGAIRIVRGINTPLKDRDAFSEILRVKGHGRADEGDWVLWRAALALHSRSRIKLYVNASVWGKVDVTLSPWQRL